MPHVIGWEVFAAACLAALGFGAVYVIERLSRK